MSTMKERPIIFTHNIPQIIDGSKTQTRRTRGLDSVNANPDDWKYMGQIENGLYLFRDDIREFRLRVACPFGVKGDRLWVRETWASDPCYEHLPPARIPRSGTIYYDTGGHLLVRGWHKFRSPIHMPHWASRITLEVLSVRPERLQEISAEDAIDEGADMPFASLAEGGLEGTRRRIREIAFPALWDSLNARRGFTWQSSPWAWRIEFRRLPA